MPGYSEHTDQQLAEMLCRGIHGAYLEIYDRYKLPLQQHAYRKLGNSQDVQDVLQELFTELWHKRENIRFNSSLSHYLFTAIRNRSLNIIYRKKKEKLYLDSLEEFIHQGNYIIDLQIREKEFSLLIQSEINALPPRMKEVYLLSRELGLTHKQIAERLGTSETTVSKQMTNVLKILRKKLGSLYFAIFLL